MQLISYKLYGNPFASWGDYLVALLSFGRYSHSEIRFSNGESLAIYVGKKAELRARTYLPVDTWEVTELHISSREEQMLYRYVKDNIVGKSYDYGGAMLSIFGICTLQSKDKVFCSEAVADLLKMTKIYSGLKKGCKYSPVSLHKAVIAINDDDSITKEYDYSL